MIYAGVAAFLIAVWVIGNEIYDCVCVRRSLRSQQGAGPICSGGTYVGILPWQVWTIRRHNSADCELTVKKTGLLRRTVKWNRVA